MYIVPAIYSISLCRECTNEDVEYRINTGEAIKWSLVGKTSEPTENCTVLIRMDVNQGANYSEEFLMDFRGETVLRKPEGTIKVFMQVQGIQIVKFHYCGKCLMIV